MSSAHPFMGSRVVAVAAVRNMVQLALLTHAGARAQHRDMRSFAKVFVLSWLSLGACVGDSTVGGDGGPDTGVDACAVGNEGCACTSGGVCNPGLECLSKLCVNPNKDAGPDSSPSDGGAGDAAPCANQPPFADPIAAVPCTAPACLVSDGGSDYVKCESNGTTCTSTDNGIILACSAGSSSCNSSQVCCLQGANTSGSCPTLAAVVSGTSVTACQSGTCPTGQIQLCNTTAQCKTGSCVYGALVLSGTKGAYLGLCQ